MRMAPIEHASAIPQEPRAPPITMASSENREPEGRERYDAEQQPTEGVRFEEVAGRAAIEQD